MAVEIHGETAICSLEVKLRSTEAYYDPDTSIKITIRNARTGNLVVNSQDMTKDDTGQYHYDYSISGGRGTYKVLYVCVNGPRTTKLKDTFTIEEESD